MLEYGSEQVPKSLSVQGAGEKVIVTPIFGAVVETSAGLVLLDTGISGTALRDPAALSAIYGADRHPWGAPGWAQSSPLQAALATVGLSIGDLSLAAVSHLHLDHCGGVPELAAAGVPVAIQGRELAFGRARAAQGTEQEVAFYRSDYLGFDVDWRELDGDEQLAPGVWSFFTPGHTPGHMSYRVDLPDTGRWLFSADAADLGENLLECIPCGSVADPADAPAATASIQRLVEEGRTLGARVVPGHDSVFWRAVWHPNGGHR